MKHAPAFPKYKSIQHSACFLFQV